LTKKKVTLSPTISAFHCQVLITVLLSAADASSKLETWRIWVLLVKRDLFCLGETKFYLQIVRLALVTLRVLFLASLNELSKFDSIHTIVNVVADQGLGFIGSSHQRHFAFAAECARLDMGFLNATVQNVVALLDHSLAV
jgi:hypothetical protein